MCDYLGETERALTERETKLDLNQDGFLYVKQ